MTHSDLKCPCLYDCHIFQTNVVADKLISTILAGSIIYYNSEIISFNSVILLFNSSICDW